MRHPITGAPSEDESRDLLCRLQRGREERSGALIAISASWNPGAPPPVPLSRWALARLRVSWGWYECRRRVRHAWLAICGRDEGC